ncbi:MAG: hypothetical protein ACTSRK_00635 [Promethearchaeota archaeon]
MKNQWILDLGDYFQTPKNPELRPMLVEPPLEPMYLTTHAHLLNEPLPISARSVTTSIYISGEN